MLYQPVWHEARDHAARHSTADEEEAKCQTSCPPHLRILRPIGAYVIVALATTGLPSYVVAVIARSWIVDRAILPHAVLGGARIASVGGRIVAVDQPAAAAEAERLPGTLLPGFIDLQVNGAGGSSVDEATPAALQTVAEAVYEGGATAFLPTLITAPWSQLLEQVRAVAAWIERWSPDGGATPGPGAEPLGLHLEGPFLTTPGAHPPEHFLDPTPERIDELLDAARGKLRLITIGNARAGAAAATKRLVAAGVTVALGHCDRGDGFKDCVDAGAKSVTHLFNVMGPLHHRDLGPAALALDDARVSCPIIVDGVHVAATMVRNAFQILGPDRTILVTDAVAAAGMPDGTYTLAGMSVTKKDGVVRDQKNNLAGSALTMAIAARNFLQTVETAGEWTLAKIASTNPARLIHAAGYGALARDQRAAFTLLGDDGTVRCIR
jgi:N-acetylglucosamine-6-phosphate deacetylase